ncbi:hypothetical protein OUZ56_024551 [Daphnia magna]|uniref:Uncharacterized protein n=1 Tax=Daphnia magna TaxID=35525 RepID=A0ABR0B0Y0_9CRUS|nr:hypothetical protein OUZ56_024551 [Daphnia magna]
MMSLFNKPVNNTTEGLPRNERNLSITQLPATKLKPQSTIDSPLIATYLGLSWVFNIVVPRFAKTNNIRVCNAHFVLGKPFSTLEKHTQTGPHP